MPSNKVYKLIVGFVLTLTISNIALSQKLENTAPVDIDYLTFSRGAIPLSVSGDGEKLKTGFEHALAAIDGNPGSYGLMLKPGGPETSIEFLYELPALTNFSNFAIPDISETPSPSQTFIATVEIFGSNQSADEAFDLLATSTLQTHTEKNQITNIPVTDNTPVRWVKVVLSGGINILTEKTFFEFSEIIGNGNQEPVELIDRFSGIWKGRGVLMELSLDNTLVTGCYDHTGDLTGAVAGHVLTASGIDRHDGTLSTFVLTVTPDGVLRGVRSSNGGPFRIYTEDTALDGTETKCFTPEAPPLGCGSIVYGINFDYDSAVIKSESGKTLSELFSGLEQSQNSSIIIEGHTSSEGSDSYNQDLS